MKNSLAPCDSRGRGLTYRVAELLLLLLALWSASVVPLCAAEPLAVELRGVHLCCARCRTAIETALRDTTGVDQVQVREEAPVTFRAIDQAATTAALQAVAAAGFGAQALANGSELAFPVEEIAEDLRSDRVVFRGVHVCCKSCSRAIAHALENLPNVQSVDCHVKERRVTLTGHDLSPLTIRRALIDAGFYGLLER